MADRELQGEHLRRIGKAHLDSLQQAGVEWLPVAAARPRAAPPRATVAVPPAHAGAFSLRPHPTTTTGPLSARTKTLPTVPKREKRPVE